MGEHERRQFSDPNMLGSYPFHMLVKMTAWIGTANARTLVDVAVPVCEFYPKGPAFVEVCRSVEAYNCGCVCFDP